MLVTTPSTVALADVRKAMEMFRQVNVEILGVVENMSFFSCPHCQGAHRCFWSWRRATYRRHLRRAAARRNRDRSANPHRRRYRQTSGLAGRDAPGAKSIYAMARAVAARVEVKPAAARGSVVEID